MKIHFIGIGGIGVSALAKYYLEKGYRVTGSDLVSSEIIEALKKGGARITVGKQKKTNISPNTDMVIYSPAVQLNNPELQRAQKLKIRCQSYPEALGELTKNHFTIAVSGTHGKSTTTAMLGILLTKAGFDPTVIVGTKLKEFENSNCRTGSSKYLIIEADEHFASFLNYWPKIIILTNIEADHLDYYKNLKNLKEAFNKFISHLPKDGVLITNKSIDKKVSPKIKKILKVPGAYNIYNASLALAVARVLKIPDKVSFKALSEYKGCWRRFEQKNVKIDNKKIILVSDYAHHPTEIRATLKAAREKWPRKEIWCIYQPHQYQRTYYLLKDFIKVFKRVSVDKLIITDIYDVAGREEKKIKKKIDAAKIVNVIKKPWALYLPKVKIIDYLKESLKGGEIVIIMGAGDIYNLFLELTKRNRKDKIN